MSDKIKVLLADDSSVVRHLLKEVLERDGSIDVVGQARHGAEAVGFFPQCNPDVVLLDVEMPEMDGVEAAGAIRALNCDVPIIMFSSLTTRGGEATLDALTAGASDYVAKPSGKGHVTDAIDQIEGELVPKIRAWASRRKASADHALHAAAPIGRRKGLLNMPGAKVLAVGSSTGGPDALSTFLRELPTGFPLPVVIVQHMPPVFTKLLAERLNKTCLLKVQEATDGVELRPGEVWIAPGDKHMTVVKGAAGNRIALGSGPPENSCRPAVDVLFRSVAECYGAAAIAVVLTGMGRDGLVGSQTIHAAGGTILVQDEASSVVWGMPGCVAHEQLAVACLPPAELGQEIARISTTSLLSAAAK
ncbi:MAG: chemotaxis response regulator protein-glutamate methylesterase [Planctomycetales bacterium]|nr:chemotaxis response regulator protein-glutamate methylesterase [Planctomycetales bacterium]